VGARAGSRDWHSTQAAQTKQLKRIFNRFYRVQTRGLKQIKGTGLGLYIVRAIAKAHGGRVFAQSEGEGHGATFIVELPRLARV
jgi:two-component system, OmpR family, sensor histidine kinase SenX3